MIKSVAMNYVTKQYETSVVGVGTTLYTATDTERVMSDVWDYVTRAYYWDGERVANVWVDDAHYTPAERRTVVEIDADYSAILPQVYSMFLKQNVARITAAMLDRAKDPAITGRVVSVVGGRTNRGATGKVVVVKEMPYGMGYRTAYKPKLGIALDDATSVWTAPNGKQYPRYTHMIWVWAHNCETVAATVDSTAVTVRAAASARAELERVIADCLRSGKIDASITADAVIAAT